MHDVPLPTHDDVRDAANLLDGVAHRTPVFRSASLDAKLGTMVFFKGEHLQRVGAFKFRGAYNAITRLTGEQRAGGVLTWSSGNHAQAVALAGRLHGVSVKVVMPADAEAIKRAATIGYGAEVITCEVAERERVGMEIAEADGRTIIPPYDHPDIIAGQGTAALELLQDHAPLDAILVPVGGGGLLAGSVLAASGFEGSSGRTEVIGVEPAAADDAARSLASGDIVRISPPTTIADGLRTPYLGRRNFAVIQQHVRRIVTVEEDEIRSALRWLWLRMKLVVEPSGAVPLAPLLAGKVSFAGRRVGVVLSGGNVDPMRIAELLAD